MYDLGSRLKAIRLQRGLTQKALARKINKSISAVSSYESNAQLPPLDVLESIARILNVSIDYLVGLDSSTFSTRSMTAAQKEIIDLLLQEFSSEDNFNQDLTARQIRILQKLFCQFVSKERTKEGAL